jgi:hypothetical protein
MFDAMRRIAGAAYARATLRTRSIRTARHRLDMLAARGCRFLMAIPYLKSGGAERVAANLTHALAHLYGPESIAVLVTDWRGLIVRLIFPERTPNSYPLKVEFTNIVHLGHAPYDERVWDLKTALLSMQPQMVLNVNSHAARYSRVRQHRGQGRKADRIQRHAPGTDAAVSRLRHQ